MGLFKSKEEKELKKKQRELKKEKTQLFFCDTLQPIGKIPQNACVGLSLIPDKKCLNIHHEQIDITLPYERILSFKVDNEVNLAKSNGTIGRAIAGGILFGNTGAIVGGMSGKGNTTVKWFGTLLYQDKDGNKQELNFLERKLTGYYDGANKSISASQFEECVNRVVSKYADDITEL